MTEQSDLEDERNDPQAQQMIRVIEDFVRTFEKRAGGHAADVILKEHTRLDSRNINQKAERFIEDTLIEPTADVLNWDLRFRPKGFEGLEGRIPDFTLLNIGIENFGEVKTPGEINQARKESVEYLDRATERPIVGIATDGFTWILYTGTEGEEPMYTSHKRIYGIIRKIRIEQAHDRADRRSRPELRREVYDFISEFSRMGIKREIERE